jgi:hypothetical protein
LEIRGSLKEVRLTKTDFVRLHLLPTMINLNPVPPPRLISPHQNAI